jgi:hypothetical protein
MANANFAESARNELVGRTGRAETHIPSRGERRNGARSLHRLLPAGVGATANTHRNLHGLLCVFRVGRLCQQQFLSESMAAFLHRILSTVSVP